MLSENNTGLLPCGPPGQSRGEQSSSERTV